MLKHRRSVAVLGFKNLAGKPDEAWLSTAISEMLTTNLAAGEELRLVPGETIAQMKNNLSLAEAESYAQETLDKIRRQTSADDVVIGSYLALGSATEGKVTLDLKLQEAQAGETIVAFSEEGKEAELMDLVSRAGARLREKLGAGDIAPNDLAADGHGGAYFTSGFVYYANPNGTVSLVADNIRSNGIVFSPDDKILYVTNGGTVVAFDVKAPGIKGRAK